MSVVITSDRLGAYSRTLESYIHNFWGFLDDHMIKTAGYQLPAFSEYGEIVVGSPAGEQLTMFWDWMESNKVYWPGFSRKWKYHFFATNQYQQFKDDWIPPTEYTIQYATKYSLPQYPQERRKISDPFDSQGRKRSIRVHLGEKPVK